VSLELLDPKALILPWPRSELGRNKHYRRLILISPYLKHTYEEFRLTLELLENLARPRQETIWWPVEAIDSYKVSLWTGQVLVTPKEIHGTGQALTCPI
jgi:hypothetical protein